METLDEYEQKILNWQSLKIKEALTEFIKNSGFEISEFIQNQFFQSDEVKSYCPRCMSEFSVAEGTCSECEGINLEQLEPIKSP